MAEGDNHKGAEVNNILDRILEAVGQLSHEPVICPRYVNLSPAIVPLLARQIPTGVAP